MRKKIKESDLTVDQIHHLLAGWCLDSCIPYCSIGYPFENKEHREKLYWANRNYLLSCIGASSACHLASPHYEYGTRPQAFWEYEIGQKPPDQLKYLEENNLLQQGEKSRMEWFKKQREKFYQDLRAKSAIDF